MDSEKNIDGVTVNDDGSFTLTLSRPLMVDSVPISSVQMREPTLEDEVVGDKVAGSDLDKEVALFANLCMLKPADLRRLRSRDYRRLRAAYATHFFD